MSRFLSHDKTKADLTNYRCKDSRVQQYKLVIPRATKTCFFSGQQSRKIRHTVDLRGCPGITAKPTGCTDGFLLPRHRCPSVSHSKLRPHAEVHVHFRISSASGVVEIEPIWKAIGAERVIALPTFHAFTGADNTGRFSRIGKATWLQVYMKADRDVISSLHMLSTEAEVTEAMLATLGEYAAQTKLAKGLYIKTISELRWHLF